MNTTYVVLNHRWIAETVMEPCGAHYVPKVVIRDVYTCDLNTAQAVTVEE